ncbi:MAG: hypothetical protein ABI664_12860 [bacterium]
MTRNIALTLTMGAVALVLVGKTVSQHSDRHVTQVAASTSADDSAKSGYIIASS